MLDEDLTPTGRWRLRAAIVLVLIVAVLAGFLPAVFRTSVAPSQRLMQCGKHQSQLLAALVAYQTQDEVAYPGPLHPAIGAIGDPHRARQATAQMLGILARAQSLPLQLLTCPDSRSSRLTPLTGPPPASWALDTGSAVYAFDWACPSDPGANRVVFADRFAGAHAGAAMAVFGDAHSQKLKHLTPGRAPGTLVTEAPDGTPMAVAVLTPDADTVDDDGKPVPPDDIYSDTGDRSDPAYDPLAPGKADPRRAWVK